MNSFNFPCCSLKLRSRHRPQSLLMSLEWNNFGRCSVWEANGLPSGEVCLGRLTSRKKLWLCTRPHSKYHGYILAYLWIPKIFSWTITFRGSCWFQTSWGLLVALKIKFWYSEDVNSNPYWLFDLFQLNVFFIC